MTIEACDKFTQGSDRKLARRLEIILEKNEPLTDLLKLDGSDIVDMRNGLYIAMKLLDERETDADTKHCDQIEIIFNKVEMIPA